MHKSAAVTLACCCVLALVLSNSSLVAQGQPSNNTQASVGAGFTYQGQLKKNGGPYTGTCSFTFGLFDAASTGNQIGSSQTLSVAVANGLFTVLLGSNNEFGAAPFDGSPRWLDISVKCPGDASPIPLGRQQLSATPYASYALAAGSVQASGISGVLPVTSGGTGSATKNFVDLSTAQTVTGLKTFATGNLLRPGPPFAVSQYSKSVVTNLNADMVDGLHASLFQQHYKNVKIVAKSGGDFTTISAALASISDAGAANPYLVWVAPGVYTETVVMMPYVDIQGAGEGLTKITSSGSVVGTVIGADNAALSFLTVENTGNNANAAAVSNSSTSPTLHNLTLTASGGTVGNYGILNDHSSAQISLLNIVVQGGAGADSYGIYNSISTPSETQLKITVSGGGGNNSYGIYQVLIYNKTPLVSQVNINASGSNWNYGIYNLYSSGLVVDQPEVGQAVATFDQLVINATGGTDTRGIQCNSGMDCNVSHSIVNAAGASNTNIGVDLSNTITTRMDNMTISASGASAVGLNNSGHTVRLVQSMVSGQTNSIYNYDVEGAFTSIGGSELGGGAVSGTNFTCAAVYSDSFAALNSTCH